MHLALLLLTIVQAQDTVRDTSSTLTPVTITATRPHPNSSTQKTHSSKALASLLPSADLPSLLEKLPSITATTDAGSGLGYGYFRLRGLESTRLTITLDGLPLSEPEDQGVYFSNLPGFLATTNNLTLTRGTAPGASGTIGYAGSLDFASAQQPLSGADLSLRAGSFSTYTLGSTLSTGLPKPFAAALSAYTAGSKGYRDGSFYKGNLLAGSLTYANQSTLARLAIRTGSARNGMAYLAVPKSILDTAPKFNPLTSDEQDRFRQHLLTATVTRHLDTQSRHTLDFGAALNHVSGNYDILFAPDMLNFGVSGITTPVRLAYVYRTISSHLQITVLGTAAFRDHFLRVRPDLDNSIYENTGHRKSLSTTISASHQFGQATFGASQEFRRSTFSYIPSALSGLSGQFIGWNFLNPHIWASYDLAPSLLFSVSAGSTSREPTRSDLFGGFDDLDTTNSATILPLTKITPERMNNIEASLRSSSIRADFTLTAFYMKVNNEIAPLGPLSYIGLPLRKNIDRSTRKGLEIATELRANKFLSILSQASFIHARINNFTDDALGQSFANTPSIMTPSRSGRLAAHFRRDPFSLSLDAQGHSKLFLTNTGDTRFIVPAATWYGASASYDRSNMTLNLRAENLTNSRKYTGGYTDYTESYYFAAAPRAVFLDLTWRLR